jgi:hypothetical protein
MNLTTEEVKEIRELLLNYGEELRDLDPDQESQDHPLIEKWVRAMSVD